MEYTPAAFVLKEKARKAFREMLVCGLILSVVVAIMELTNGDGHLSAMVLIPGLLYSPIVWAIYKFGRFVIGR